MKIRIFTDGACSGNPGPGGWAAIILFSDNHVELVGCNKDTTNNRMELTAVIKAIEYVRSNKITTKVDIYSDSAYVVNAVNKGWLKKWQGNGWRTNAGSEVKNMDLWEIFLKLLNKNKKRNINFVKVKGHSGHIHNERVDDLAREQSELAKVLEG
jgi:ribonuclease HI